MLRLPVERFAHLAAPTQPSGVNESPVEVFIQHFPFEQIAGSLLTLDSLPRRAHTSTQRRVLCCSFPRFTG